MSSPAPSDGSDLSVRARLLIVVIGLVFAVVVVISGYFIWRNQINMGDAMASKSAMMRQDLRKKGMALARNVALASQRAVLVMDFLFLTEVINSTVGHDDEIVYGVIMDGKRRALVHTDPKRAGQVLDTPAAHFAAEQAGVTSQELTLAGRPVLEVVAPIHVGEERWGTIRFGLSLANLNQEIALSEERAKARITSSLLATLISAILLIIVASVIATLSARTLLRPLDRLMQGVQRIREGRLDTTVEVEGAPEFVALGNAINKMTQSVRDRDAALRQNMADLERALQVAEEASRLKSEFVANISHELRTPLNTIVNVPTALLKQYESFQIWHCERCDTDFQSDDDSTWEDGTLERCPDCDVPMEQQQRLLCTGDLAEHQHFLGRLRQSGQHLLNVVNDLLDFSKMEAGRMDLHRTEVEVDKALADLEETIGPLASEKKIALVIDTPEEPLRLAADEVKLVQVFINLVGNAIRFTDEDGTIEVGARPTVEEGVEMIRFWTTDDGIGIPQDQLEAIFEGFRQVDGSHTRRHGGTGLGLAITKRLVELHGGRIWAESTEGAGSTFTFLLPIEGDVAAATSPAWSTGDHGNKDRVMVIDDNQVQLEIARMVLEREGFATELIATANEALGKIESSPPRFIILDIMMPEVSGISILRQLKENPATRDIPVFVATAYHSNRDVVERLGGIWLPKPWNASELVEHLRAHLD